MKNFIFTSVLFFLLLTPFHKIYSQSLSATEPTTVTFSSESLPVWVSDLRRWEIVAFGTFPFSLFAVTFITDMVRWGVANGMDFSEAGRRYAPWPLKSAGAEMMSNADFQRTILIAAGLSVALAFADFIIVSVRRNNERLLLESAPSGSVIIERIPPQSPSGSDDDSSGADTPETDGGVSE